MRSFFGTMAAVIVCLSAQLMAQGNIKLEVDIQLADESGIEYRGTVDVSDGGNSIEIWATEGEAPPEGDWDWDISQQVYELEGDPNTKLRFWEENGKLHWGVTVDGEPVEGSHGQWNELN